MLRMRRSPADGGLVLVHPGRADGWWHLGGGRFAWHDGELLFVERADEVLALPVEGPLHVVPTGDGCVVTSPDAEIRIGAEVERGHPRDVRLGGVDARRIGLEWVTPGLELPLGARRSRRLRPFPAGRGAVWAADGWLYRSSGRAEVLGAEGAFLVGPRGAVLVGDDAFDRAAAPGRPLQPLPCPLAPPVRSSPDGARAQGVGPDGEGVTVDLVANRVVERHDAAPVGDGWLFPDGRLTVGGDTVRVGVREASWAVRGDRLAGPGGRVRDLRTGEPVGDGQVFLGATVATDAGFTTVHWETGEGLHLDPDGRVIGTFRLPLDEDDVVVDGVAEGGGARFGTAMGAGWRVTGSTVEPAEAPEVEHPEPPDGWEIPVEAEAVVHGRRWGWTTDGLLLVRPA